MGYHFTLHPVLEKPVVRGPSLPYAQRELDYTLVSSDEAYLGKSPAEFPHALIEVATLYADDHWALSRESVLATLQKHLIWTSSPTVAELLDKFPDTQWFVMVGG